MNSILPIVLKPFVQFCIRHSYRINDVLIALKRTYVEVARAELEKQGKACTASALSAMTGLHRKDTSKLLGGTLPSNDHTDLMTRVLGKWQGSSRYTTPSGKPRTLSAQGEKSDFFQLVRSVSFDLNPYTVLNELLRVGAIQRTAQGVKISLKVFNPRGDSEKLLQMMARETQLVMNAIEENMQQAAATPNLHINTTYDNISDAKLSSLRTWILKRGSAFHDSLRKFLSKLDRDINPHAPEGKKRLQISVSSVSHIQLIEKKKKK